MMIIMITTLWIVVRTNKLNNKVLFLLMTTDSADVVVATLLLVLFRQCLLLQNLFRVGRVTTRRMCVCCVEREKRGRKIERERVIIQREKKK